MCVVQSLIGPEVGHDFVNVVLGLRESDLGNVTIRFVGPRASNPARQIICATVVRTCHSLRLIGKLLKEIREILRSEENRRVSVVEFVLVEVVQLQLVAIWFAVDAMNCIIPRAAATDFASA